MLVKPSCLLFALPLIACSMPAQTNYDQLSAGANYTHYSYYKLTDGSTQEMPNEAWDIAFCNLGAQYAGIFINESTTIASGNSGQSGPGVEAYDPQVSDFNQVISTANLNENNRLLNPDKSWADGAFNAMRDSSNASDFGWGLYQFQNHSVVGNRVFVLKMRDGSYRKIIFDSFDGSNYTFRLAHLDGSNLETHTVPTQLGNGCPVQYYSFTNGVMTSPPSNWDFVFGRYNAWATDGQVYLNYNVTGLLADDGLLIARATGVNPATVSIENYYNAFENRMDVIGHDWKIFSGGSYVVQPDLAFFVKTREGKLYKLVLIDFEGSSTGVATVERTYLGVLSASETAKSNIQDVLVYPDPVSDHFTLAFTNEKAGHGALRLVDVNGQTVWNGNFEAQEGLNAWEIDDLPVLPSGVYTLNLELNGGQISRRLLIGGW